MTLPTDIRLDGNPIVPVFRSAKPMPVDFGRYELATNLELAKAYPVRAFVVRHDGLDHRWMIFNAVEDPDAPPLKLAWTDEDGTRHGPHFLGSGEGFQWVDDRVTEAITDGVTTPWDGWMTEQVVSDYGIDIAYTPSKGSGNAELHSPEGVVMLKHGVSLAGYRWLNAYLAKQLLRSRHRWFGVYPYGADGKLREPISEFSYTETNEHGFNAYDPGHFDVNELFWGWMLTGDPAFLLELIHVWCHAFQHVPSFDDAVQSYNPRQDGWPLVAADLLLRATADMPAAFAGLRAQAIEFVRDHVASSRERFPIVDVYAIPSVYLDADGNEVEEDDEGAKKLFYTHTWHYAPVMLACDRLAETLWGMAQADEELGELANMCAEHANELAAWVNDELYIAGADKPIATKFSQEPVWFGYADMPGVADWFAGPLSVRADPGAMGEYLIQRLMDEYAGRSPYYESFAIGKIPRQLGYDDLPAQVVTT